MPNNAEHWNRIFHTKADAELGWYESDVAQTLKFLQDLPGLESAKVFLAGAGTSILVDELLVRCRHLLLNDLSEVALQKLEGRITDQQRVSYLRHDLSKPFPGGLPPVDLWIDRAVLHFLLEEGQIDEYFRNLRTVVKEGGFVLLAEFAPDGAPQCAGLDLHRYSIDEMTERLGSDFALVRQENYVFMNPFDEPRPYLYALFRRTS